MEAFAGMFRKATFLNLFKGVKLPNGGPSLSHLLYADDALVLGDWSLDNVKTVNRLFTVFNICSGLKINFSKSNLFGLGVVNKEVEAMAKVLGCKMGNTLFVYLGVKVGANMNRISNWDPVVQVVRNRLSKWKASVLSIGGRATLIKSVLESIPTYYFSLFKAPAKVIANLESMIKNFLWEGDGTNKKIHWVAWLDVTRPKKQGGLGLPRLEWCNKSLLSKWIWRYREERNALWRSVLEAIHGSSRQWEAIPSNARLASNWNSLVRLEKQWKLGGQRISERIKGVIGDGKDVRFWLDIWVGLEPLKNTFPLLFMLESEKKCRVADRILASTDRGQFCWKWKRMPRTAEEVQQLVDCCRILNQIRLRAGRDSWLWLGHGSDTFSVAAVKKIVIQEEVQPTEVFFKWCKWVPRWRSKDEIFWWKSKDAVFVESLRRRWTTFLQNAGWRGKFGTLFRIGGKSLLYTLSRFGTYWLFTSTPKFPE
ncbi:reverse transcriptase domain, Reverse transcriptase zinc-binding domain protein [Artemisia annua]|uniref:Reverse transcriptase domain, Reverse transcriptase zinc-binding domain protein n=1 Tax=Artemisia annua TaxID=35608 RepID=A0A2U1NMR6_ARTAN|nr:reverse transcriptase domain, Reverse transcriptase zinc-binding domain protein [Artemisia annua]